jgi:hypothetical protein
VLLDGSIGPSTSNLPEAILRGRSFSECARSFVLAALLAAASTNPLAA